MVPTAAISGREGGMPWPKIGGTQYQAQLGLTDKDRTKGWLSDGCYLN